MKYKLAHKFIVAIIAFSLLSTVALTAVQVYYEFERDRYDIHRLIRLVEKSTLPSLEEAIWIADEELLTLHLQGLLRNPYIIYAKIDLPDGNDISVGENAPGIHSVKYHNKLFYTHNGAKNQIGEFTLIASEENLYDDMSKQFLSALVVNATLIFLISIFFYVLFKHLIGKHLLTIVDYLVRYDKNNSHTRLQVTKTPPFNGRDEIDILADSINNLVENLTDSETRNKTILDTAADGIFTAEADGTITDFNKAAERIFGYTADEIIGANIAKLIRCPNQSSAGVEYQIGLSSGEVEGVCKNGEVVPLEMAISNMTIADKPMYSGIVRNIAERKRIDKMKSEFISTVSHELRTPLTSIRGSLGLLTSGTTGELPEQATEMLSIASNNTTRLLLLINDILDIQKIESGQMAFQFRDLDLADFLQKAVRENIGYADQYNVRFVIAKDMAKGRVYVDPDRMMQVMANLLSNAAKFSPEGETVEISTAQYNHRLRICVTDHGPGIPEEFHEKVFDKFTQLDSSDTRNKGGTGLGMSISRMIVEKHGGKLSFISHKGIGTTFYIDLPELADNQEQHTAHTHYSRVSAKVPHILIVEDDRDVAALLQRMLAESGYNSHIAYDISQARNLLKENGKLYRLITLDLILSGDNAIAFIKELRADTHHQDIPIVVVSAQADETKHRLNGGAVGVFDWLQKPIDQDRLLAAVKQAAGDGRTPRVLHVEDEMDVHTIVSHILRDWCELLWTTTLEASKELLQSHEFELVLLDIGLPDGSGLELLNIIEQCPRPPQVVIFSAYDVSQEYADKVNAVLIKSRTSETKLAEVITHSIKNRTALN